MRAIVLKPFPYSDDGVNTRTLPVGLEMDFPDNLVSGLVTENLIMPKSEGDRAQTKALKPDQAGKEPGPVLRDRIVAPGTEGRPSDPQKQMEPTRTADPSEVISQDGKTGEPKPLVHAPGAKDVESKPQVPEANKPHAGKAPR